MNNKAEFMNELRNEELEKVTGGAEFKVYFDVILADAGASKIGVIKVVKEITGLGLKESKALVDDTPSRIAEGVLEEQALDYKYRLECAGAKVELK